MSSPDAYHPTPPCKPLSSAARALLRLRNPDREYCVVSEWIWVDFQGSSLMVEGLALQGVSPSILVATRREPN